jgi:cell division protein FtsB
MANKKNNNDSSTQELGVDNDGNVVAKPIKAKRSKTYTELEYNKVVEALESTKMVLGANLIDLQVIKDSIKLNDSLHVAETNEIITQVDTLNKTIRDNNANIETLDARNNKLNLHINELTLLNTDLVDKNKKILALADESNKMVGYYTEKNDELIKLIHAVPKPVLLFYRSYVYKLMSIATGQK